MTVFIAHAPADQAHAEALEKTIERRGLFAELDDGQTALRPVQGGDVLVLLASQALLFATARLRLEQRALDAWAVGRLVVVKLDHGIAPVGLRDLPAIDASFEAQREFKWNEVADAIREKLKAPEAPADLSEEDVAVEGSPTRSGQERPDFTPDHLELIRRKKERGHRTGGRAWAVLIATVLASVPGLVAFAVAGSIWLANRIGPTPGGLTELRQGIGEFGARFGLPNVATEIAFGMSMLLTIAIIVYWGARFVIRRKPLGPARRSIEPIKQGDAMFVSYARVNESAVMPVIEAAKQAGRKFWIDQKGIAAGDGWAGEIVRAIRGAPSVMVMCSQAAFESDHVKREIYLADRYKKKLMPVFLEQVEAPEDFEYFFAGVQALNLFDKPEAERPQALVAALGSI